MLTLILFLLLALAVILVASPGWRNPPVGIGVLIAAAVAVVAIYSMIGHR
jgi:ABC-type transport system involved in multi-copper enzyme maturation permease subunit